MSVHHDTHDTSLLSLRKTLEPEKRSPKVIKMTTTFSASTSFLAMTNLLFLLFLAGTPSATCFLGVNVVVPSPPLHLSTTVATTAMNRRNTISRRGGILQRVPTTVLHAIRCENKYYQLEEMEDQDTCTTEVFLNVDRTASLGPTDGPQPLQAMASWQIGSGIAFNAGPNDFKMTIVRKFKAGDKHKDMGEFSYEVKRTYKGEMTMVGASVGITGVIENVAPDGTTQQVGFFNMIDGTDEREGYGTMAAGMKMTSR